MSRQLSLISSLLLLGSFGCESNTSADKSESTPQQICEHAQKRVRELNELDAQAAEQDAPPDQKATARERSQQITETIHGKFMEVCLELDGDDLQCMAKIDGYVDAVLPAQRSEIECRAKDPTACEIWDVAIHQAYMNYGACFDVLTTVLATATLRGGPEPKRDTKPVLETPPDEALVDGGPSEVGTEVDEAKLTVDGPLDPSILKRILRAHRHETHSCYEAGLSKNPSLSGEVTIEFTIGPAGTVSKSAAAEASSISESTVTSCIAEAVKNWRFPKPRGGGQVDVIWTFALSPS